MVFDFLCPFDLKFEFTWPWNIGLWYDSSHDVAFLSDSISYPVFQKCLYEKSELTIHPPWIMFSSHFYQRSFIFILCSWFGRRPASCLSSWFLLVTSLMVVWLSSLVLELVYCVGFPIYHPHIHNPRCLNTPYLFSHTQFFIPFNNSTGLIFDCTLLLTIGLIVQQYLLWIDVGFNLYLWF